MRLLVLVLATVGVCFSQSLSTSGLVAFGQDPRVQPHHYTSDGNPTLGVDLNDATPEQAAEFLAVKSESSDKANDDDDDEEKSEFGDLSDMKHGAEPLVAQTVEMRDAHGNDEMDEGNNAATDAAVQVSASMLDAAANEQKQQAEQMQKSINNDNVDELHNEAGGAASNAVAEVETALGLGKDAFLPISQVEKYNEKLHEARKRLDAHKKQWAKATKDAQRRWDDFHRRQKAAWDKEGKVLSFDRDVKKKVDILSRRLFKQYVNFFQRYYLKPSSYASVAVAMNRGTDATRPSRFFKTAVNHFPARGKVPRSKKMKITALGDPNSVSPRLKVRSKRRRN